MKNFYTTSFWALGVGLLLTSASAAQAQAPTITSITPMANARAAARTGPVTVSFSQPLTAASVGALKVYSAQRGGLRTRATTPATVSSNVLGFLPAAYSFVPGETVQYTVTTAAMSSGGALAQARVGQFTVAVGGSGNGTFGGGSNPSVGPNPQCVALGDVDNDGDLDLLTANANSGRIGGGTVSVRFNNSSGAFSGTQEVAVGTIPQSVALADIDGDGDLDLLTANYGGGTVSVRLNDGSGTFSGSQDVTIGSYPTGVAVGDVDGDGDLDLLAAAYLGTVGVRLNDGNGTFSGAQNVAVGSGAYGVAVGDVDGDGDLDLLTPGYGGSSSGPNTVSVRLNNGSGTFSGAQEVVVGNRPHSLAVADVDDDGDLDLLTASYSGPTPGTVSVRLNNGSGTFSGNQEVGVGNSSPFSLAMGDVDGDGDLDLLTANQGSSGTVSIRLNSGGTFAGGSDLTAIGNVSLCMAVGDVDGDGDLDLLVSNDRDNAVNIRLNNGPGLATTAVHSAPGFNVSPNPAHGSAVLVTATPHAPITVLDALGRVLLTATVSVDGTYQLALPTGMYLVRSGQQVGRIVVE